ncbi:hypothetical protein [Mucilaginibacter sp. dw_454]|uniref:hypothetical protein n=1 Tax=Mucilaginibacter sp. dw_454 TaxID=2720079 RepID=UPI001BD30E49|nr:hypothetical protein [Mucilaginibacter sp. dw_454]
MEHLPNYISIIFILTVLLTLLLLSGATHYSKTIIMVTLAWLVLQSIIGLSGFYTVVIGTPPRFMLLLAPPVVFIIILFATNNGRMAMNGFDIKTLTLLHIVRIPVELVLYGLFLHKVIPQVMTFEGRNFDILCGISAPFIYYFGFVRKVISRKVIVAWNVICLLLLVNIIITAVLSAPFAFQRLGFEQPSIALFYFPFILLPGFIVPIVLYAHLVSIKRLLRGS